MVNVEVIKSRCDSLGSASPGTADMSESAVSLQIQCPNGALTEQQQLEKKADKDDKTHNK